MSERRRIVAMIVIMVVACLSVATVVLTILYQKELSTTRERLRVTVQSQARLIEAIAVHEQSNVRQDLNPISESLKETIRQIELAHEAYEGFGQTGEFTLARAEGDSIVFILSHRLGDVSVRSSVAFDSKLAEPMRLALRGKSGTVVGLDYRGEIVLAAYEPVAVLNLGLVAKIDLSEVRGQFELVGLYAFVVTILLTLFGVFLLYRISNPVIQKLTLQAQKLKNQLCIQKEAEAELRKWELVFKHAGWGLVIVDAITHKIVSANPAFAAMHGYTIEEAQTVNLVDVFCEKERPLLEERSREVHEKGSLEYESTHVRKDGSAFPVLTNAQAIYGDDGTVKFRAINFQDITERNRIEDERMKLERQMLQVQKLESLGVLAGGIAHDFNNLLMTILGNADIALQDLSPHSPARSNIETIATTGHRAAELSKQMLAYSGKGQFVIESIRLNLFVEEMIHLLEVSISKTAILKFNFADNLPAIEGDPTQIRQVLMNLIINASEAIGDRSGVISISTGAHECDKDYLSSENNPAFAGHTEALKEGLFVYIEVADTGCGMSKETQEKIFDPFFTTKFTGRGLGMAAILGIVRGHHGTIRVYSEVNKGTTIKVLFPASELIPANETDIQNEISNSDWHGTGTVLIADDDDSVRAIGKKFLESFGFDVLTASDGQEAIDVYRAHRHETQFVLLDMTMPHVNGEEAFRRIRAIDKNARVILCSGYNEQEATERFVGKGLSGFLHKPYRLSDLRDILIEVLS